MGAMYGYGGMRASPPPPTGKATIILPPPNSTYTTREVAAKPIGQWYDGVDNPPQDPLPPDSADALTVPTMPVLSGPVKAGGAIMAAGAATAFLPENTRKGAKILALGGAGWAAMHGGERAMEFANDQAMVVYNATEAKVNTALAEADRLKREAQREMLALGMAGREATADASRKLSEGVEVVKAGVAQASGSISAAAGTAQEKISGIDTETITYMLLAVAGVYVAYRVTRAE